MKKEEREIIDGAVNLLFYLKGFQSAKMMKDNETDRTIIEGLDEAITKLAPLLTLKRKSIIYQTLALYNMKK